MPCSRRAKAEKQRPDRSLADKLGIRAGCCLLLAGAPADSAAYLDALPPGVRFARRPGRHADVAHLFVAGREELRTGLAVMRRRLRADAVLWVSWPKRSSGLAGDVTEDTIRELALPLGFVDVKVCAIDAVWSALKLVVRREHR
jgi:hypothetical protein